MVSGCGIIVGEVRHECVSCMRSLERQEVMVMECGDVNWDLGRYNRYDHKMAEVGQMISLLEVRS